MPSSIVRLIALVSLLLAIAPWGAPAARADQTPYVKLTFYSGTGGTGSELLKILSDQPGPVFDAPAGIRSVRLTRVAKGETLLLFVSPERKKRIDPLHPGNQPGADAWVKITALRDVEEALIGSFETTWADAFVRIEYNGPGRVDGKVTKIELAGVTADPWTLRYTLVSDLHVDYAKDSGACGNCQANQSLVKALNDLSQFKDPAGKPLGAVDLTLMAGDILDQPSYDQRDKFAEIYSALSAPYHLTSGNHDLPISKIYEDYLDALIKAQHGGLYFYSFNLQGVHFVVQYTNCPDVCAKGHNWDSFQYSLDFLQEDLDHVAAGVPIVVFQHYGFDASSAGWWPTKYQIPFFEILKGRNLAALLTGHSHVLSSWPIPGHPDLLNASAGTCDIRPGRGGSNQFWLFEQTQNRLLGRALQWDYKTGQLSWPSSPVEVDRSLGGRPFWSAPASVPDESDEPPAFTSVRGTRYRVWSSRKDQKIYYSTLDETTGRWSAARQVASGSEHARSRETPAAAFFENRLNVVWHKWGTDSMYISALDGSEWTAPVLVRGKSRAISIDQNKAPASVAVGNTLYLVYNGKGDKRLWYTSTSMAFQFADDQAIEGTYTDNNPSLTRFDDRPYVAWVKHLFNGRTFYTQSFADGAWSKPVSAGGGEATSDRAPGLAEFGGRLYLAWSDTNAIFYSYWENGSWQPKSRIPVPGVVSHRGATLGIAGDRLYLGWNSDYRAYFASLSR